MAELFRLEAESQTQALAGSLLALEREPRASHDLEVCMRAAHSLKGAARLVGMQPAVDVAHAMEDCFVAAQRQLITLDADRIDVLLHGVELLSRMASAPLDAPNEALDAEAASLVAALGDRFGSAIPASAAATASAVRRDPDIPSLPAVPAMEPASPVPPRSAESMPVSPKPVGAEAHAKAPPMLQPGGKEAAPERQRVVRVTAENFNRLLGLAGESLVESRWLKPYLGTLHRLRPLHDALAARIETLRNSTAATASTAPVEALYADILSALAECRSVLASRFEALEAFDNRSTNLATRLYNEVLACRMRPFADGVTAFPQMVRNLARSLGKEARLELVGSRTQVDRDVLEALEAPLGHLLRNAVDHGIEPPAERLEAGKSREGVVRLEAAHNAGMLQILVSDDGNGVNLDQLRAAVIARNLAPAAVAAAMTDAELLEFLFLPGFSMKPEVTEISGRGVGLDAVRNMVLQIRGSIRVTSQQGCGTHFELRLPLTLSVIRTLQALVGAEAYAFPLARIVRALRLPQAEIISIEGRPHFRDGGRLVGLIDATQLLGGQPSPSEQGVISVIMVEDSGTVHGLIVERFLGERETVVQPLDRRFGKIANIMAGGLMEDGSPVLIVDIADIVQSVERLVAKGTLAAAPPRPSAIADNAHKRVLVVDDSLTVRELERKLLDQAGYQVETAVDGMEGWNVLRSGRFDMVITDVDMPRLGGIELVRMIKQDPHLQSLPVMIVSYKDDETDRRRGLEAGADYYLPKASFHDETLLRAVVDLIGEPLS
ncbi:MAG TPA: hybrid sensor histidine kinase/response regulator [Rhodopila sp.]|uniref:hybrid sensor histidine kinase/response regulator n=1 Tax=Rhodopila sp. TaxID=2480087 RepID=UPI002CD67FD4|nr:hybrid sensor histidine kinase/response regulator [Rhodopila sp.]HVY13849.1 hybrid sensor histidine kinase/response regulator [Rhodopila sp.]